MRIHKKMMLLSLILVMLLIGVAGTILFGSNLRNAERSAADQLQTLAEKLSLQLELLVQQNDVATLFMLSDPDFLSAVSTYAMPGRDEESNRLIIQDSAAKINQVLKSYAVAKHFYCITLIWENGDYFSSNFNAPTISRQAAKGILGGLAWTQEARYLRGRMLLLPPYESPWPAIKKERVFGTIRAIATSSNMVYYIEVQRRVSELDELFSVLSFRGTNILVTDRAGKPFYRLTSQEDIRDAIEVSSDENTYGLRVHLQRDKREITALMRGSVLQIVLFCLTALAASIAYLLFTIRRITKPLRALQIAVENTALHNLKDAPLPHNADELQMLNTSFQSLFTRLNDAIEKQMQASELESQARMDALQAQIDPHFLYNTLTVIMGRAMHTGDQEIVQICEDISAMLRYSTSTQQRSARVQEEVEHARAYMNLMQKRCKDRLSFKVSVQANLMQIRLPKIILQPLVENAIRHAYKNTGGKMHIELTGDVEGSEAVLTVTDQGEGFDIEILHELNARLQSLKEGAERLGGDSSVGGIGLVNTFARLLNFFGGKCDMRLSNLEPGASVSLRIPLGGGEEKA